MDVREDLFRDISSRRVRFRVTAQQPGILAGMERLLARATEIGLEVHGAACEGQALEPGSVVLDAGGSPLQIATAEESLVGVIAKPSGIATAARRAVETAAGAKVVSGAWKKMPPELKEVVRHAVRVGGATPRITDEPFVYLDKNFVRMLGGVGAAVRAARRLPGRLVAVQIRGETGRIGDEAVEGATCGAAVLMVDTGNEVDLTAANAALERTGLRSRVRLAFGGGVTLDRIPTLVSIGADILDIGTGIVDAPILDFRLDVIG
ncbi:MAG: nicotinate-nucleotide pyrophosphorylase [Firmicutes bacterium]|nr:nicotinate-nucleotide pyrophosphorylase [Bacillota bacterium]